MASPNPAPLRLVTQGEAPEAPSNWPLPLDQLYRMYAPYVARVAGRILGHSAESDDVVQDVFIDAESGLKKLRNAAAVKSWLATLTVRKARRRLKRRRFLSVLGLNDDFDVSQVVDGHASAETLAWASAVYGVLDRLPSDARVAWVLHRVEGETLEAVASICGWSRATAHRRIQEAEALFEAELADVQNH